MSFVSRTVFLLAMLFSSASMASPPNDDYQTAHIIRPGVSYIEGILEDSTVQPGEPDISNTIRVGNSVWHKFIAPRTGLATIIAADPDCCRTEYHQIDVFGGSSFSSRNRIAIALPEYVTVNFSRRTVLRTTFPIVAGRTYHIRVSGIVWGSDAYELDYGFHFFIDAPTGGVRHVKLRALDYPLNEYSFVGATDWYSLTGYQYARYATINTTRNPRSVFGSANSPSSNVYLSSNQLRALSGSKPGLVLSELNQGSAYPNRWGLWRHNWSLTVRLGSMSSRLDIPYIIHRYRTDRTTIRVDVPTNAIARSVVGRTGTATISLTNTGNFTATNCRIVSVQRSGIDSLQMSWRVPGRPVNQPFSLLAGQSINVQLLLIPSLVGLRDYYTVYANCTEAPLENSNSYLSVEGLPN
jgi:hypothetical protein